MGNNSLGVMGNLAVTVMRVYTRDRSSWQME